MVGSRGQGLKALESQSGGPVFPEARGKAQSDLRVLGLLELETDWRMGGPEGGGVSPRGRGWLWA